MQTYKEKVMGEIEEMIRGMYIYSDEGENISEYHSEGQLSLMEALSRIKSIPDDNEWIKCSERLPEEMVRVLVLTVDGVMGVMRLDKYKSWSHPGFGYSFEHVTHWQPLPPPPTPNIKNDL